LKPKDTTTRSDRRTVLVVDDDPHILEVLEARLLASGFGAVKAADAREALEKVKNRSIDLAICDVKLPDVDGFTLFEKIRIERPGLPVIFLTAHGTIPDAVQAMKSGAVEYLTKPFDGRELVATINGILGALPPPAVSDPGVYQGRSKAMKELHDMIKKVAAIDMNVLILGESGVGKERVARMIHDLSPRRNNPLVVVDCGSTPTTLLESELFGHVKGAFTNAMRDKKGLIEAADQGTLFLDEIGNIGPEMQMRLLRFLENHKIRRIGSIRETDVNCRVLAATNSNLVDDIKAGKFREDLYYRLRVVAVTIPPLRDRREDIPDMARHFIDNFRAQNGFPPVEILPETMEILQEHDWPGNVRELKNILEAGAALCSGTKLGPEHLQLDFLDMESRSDDEDGDAFSLEENERRAILRALKQTGGVQKAAADLLGISRRAIHYKVKKYGIKP
jgi:DNA-binding NtrC family response regulator